MSENSQRSRKWYSLLTDRERLEKYYLGVTCDKPDTGGKVVLALVGETGMGKSAFIESLEHILLGLPTKAFMRQAPAAVGNESHTQDCSEVRLTDCLTVLDTEGMISFISEYKKFFGDERKTFGDGDLWSHVWHKLTSVFFKRTSTAVRFCCPIIFITAGKVIDSMRDANHPCVLALKPFVSEFKSYAKHNPLVIISRADEFESVEQQDRAVLHVQSLLGCRTFAVQNYRTNDAENAQINDHICAVLATVLRQCDLIMFDKKHSEVKSAK